MIGYTPLLHKQNDLFIKSTLKDALKQCLSSSSDSGIAANTFESDTISNTSLRLLPCLDGLPGRPFNALSQKRMNTL